MIALVVACGRGEARDTAVRLPEPTGVGPVTLTPVEARRVAARLLAAADQTHPIGPATTVHELLAHEVIRERTTADNFLKSPALARLLNAAGFGASCHSGVTWSADAVRDVRLGRSLV